MLTVKKSTYLLSRNSPKLTFCSSQSKDRLTDASAGATMLSRLTSTQATRTLRMIRVNYSNSRLTRITFHHGTYSYYLGLEQLKDRRIKSSSMLLTLWSTIIPEFLQDFQMELKDSLYDPFQSLICGIFVSSPRQVNMPSLRIWYLYH